MKRYFTVALTLLALLCFAGDRADAQTRLALVVGNSAYTNISALSNPVNDAELMAETLREIGFEVMLETDADRRRLARRILEFGTRLGRGGDDAVGLFFYAGHGVQAAGANYLLPIGAEVDTEADLEIEAINTNWVLSQMDEAGNGLNMVILDACRNNPFQSTFRSGTRGLARLDAPAGSLVAYSAAPGQVALDGDGKNSPYTKALAAAMLEPGVELLQIFRRVRLFVEEETGGRQTPWEEQSLRTDFYFVDEETSPEEQQVAVIAPEEQTEGSIQVAPPSNDSNVALELAFWNSVKDSNDAQLLQVYLDRYPNGVFAGLAEIMIARLRDGQPEQTQETPGDAGNQQPDQSASQGGQSGQDGQSGQSGQAEQGGAPPDGNAPGGPDDGSYDVANVDPQEGMPIEPMPQSYPELPRDIQAALDAVGCDPGPIDGIWGRRSQRALEDFAQYASVVLPEDQLTVMTLDLIESSDGRICPLSCGARYVERNGECVLKTCPSGQRLNSAGNCVTQQAETPPSTPPSNGGNTGGGNNNQGGGTRACGGGTCCCSSGGDLFCMSAGSCIHTYFGQCVDTGLCGG